MYKVYTESLECAFFLYSIFQGQMLTVYFGRKRENDIYLVKGKNKAISHLKIEKRYISLYIH